MHINGKCFIIDEYLYWLSTFDLVLRFSPVILFKHSVHLILIAHYTIRHHSCGNLFYCCRFTLWLSTKTWECNARICCTQPLFDTVDTLMTCEPNKEIIAKRFFIFFFGSKHSFGAQIFLIIIFILVLIFRLHMKKLKLDNIFYLLIYQKQTNKETKNHPNLNKTPSSTIFLEKYWLGKYILISLKPLETVDIFAISSDNVNFFNSRFIWLQQIWYFAYYLNSVLNYSTILSQFIDF